MATADKITKKEIERELTDRGWTKDNPRHFSKWRLWRKKKNNNEKSIQVPDIFEKDECDKDLWEDFKRKQRI